MNTCKIRNCLRRIFNYSTVANSKLTNTRINTCLKNIDLLGIAHNTTQTIDLIIFSSSGSVFHTHLKFIASVNILNPFYACSPSIRFLICILPTISIYVNTVIVCNNIIRIRYVFRDCDIPVASWFIILGLIEGYSPFQDWASLTRWIRRNCLTVYNLVVIQLSVLDLSTLSWISTIKRRLSILPDIFNISSFHRAILSCRSTTS